MTKRESEKIRSIVIWRERQKKIGIASELRFFFACSMTYKKSIFIVLCLFASMKLKREFLYFFFEWGNEIFNDMSFASSFLASADSALAIDLKMRMNGTKRDLCDDKKTSPEYSTTSQQQRNHPTFHVWLVTF